jgi:hypothetical protein
MLNSENKGTIKKATALFLALCLTLAAFTGCGAGGLFTGGDRIASPVAIHYFVQNPLTFQDHREYESDEFNYTYFTVEGLKDKAAEQAVNDRIKAVFDELRNRGFPPYRGVKKQITELSVLEWEQIYTEIAGNVNNVLSVAVHKDTTYRNPPAQGVSDRPYDHYDDIVSISEMETLNFDLNTGREISLKDMFCDDVDYMELLNDYLAKAIAGAQGDEEVYYFTSFDASLKLAESFKGISEDQVFLTGPGALRLIFDYRTPQFDTGGQIQEVRIPYAEFDGQIAATERFYREEENLYTPETPPVKSLAGVYRQDDVRGREYRNEDGLSVSRGWNWPADLPEEIEGRLEEMSRLDPEVINRWKEYAGGVSQEQIETEGSYYSIYVQGYRTGAFISTQRQFNLAFGRLREEVWESHCYDAETLKELTLSDLFVEGYDARPVVLEAIRQVIEGYEGNEAQYSQEQYEAVYEQIDSFFLEESGVMIPIVHPSGKNPDYTLFADVPFVGFGCENMVIFR